MSDQGRKQIQLDASLLGLGLGDGVALRPSWGKNGFEPLTAITTATTSTTTTMRWHMPGALRGRGLK
jgi:hypothetical protein